MRSIIYDVATSLDGYIAGPNDDISAFPGEGQHADDYFQRLGGYQTVIMGRRTYEFGYAYGLEPGKRAYPHMDHHIFSSAMALPDDAEVSVVREDWLDAVKRLKRADGGDIYLCGGGQFAGLLVANGLIDRLVLKLAPVAIGAGVRLFGDSSGRQGFTLVEAKPYDNGVVLLTYTAAD